MRLPFTKRPAHRSHPFAAFVAVTVIVFFARKFIKKLTRRHRVRVAQSEPFPYLASVSSREGCDIEGLRFLAGAQSAATITQATGREAIEPIRVYAGLAHGQTPAERVAYAMAELERLGGMERSYVMVVSPTGRGYVHPIPAETAELVTGGDVAIICVQYHDDQTLRAIRKLDIASECHLRAVDAVLARAIARRARELGVHPRVCVYGESLGAWASQEALDDADQEILQALHAGLWSGTPYASSARGRLAERLRAATAAHAVADIAHPSQLDSTCRFAFLTNEDDPIAWFSGLSGLYRPQAWTRHVGRRWIPGWTLARAILQVEAATRPVPGVREASGHDYRATVAEALARTWMGAAYDPALQQLIEDHLTERERTRRARMAFLHAAVAERE
jgi:uncharacterized membrane protein